MAVRKLTAIIDFDRLDFRQVHAVSGVLAELERLASEGAIVLSQSATKSRRTDADMGRPKGLRLQPQTQLVHDFLTRTGGGMTAVEVARGLGLKDGSANGQLNALKKRGLARYELGERNPRKRRTPNRWFAVEKPSINATKTGDVQGGGDGGTQVSQ
jgi:predicted ArsR family transcriptional regulator